MKIRLGNIALQKGAITLISGSCISGKRSAFVKALINEAARRRVAFQRIASNAQVSLVTTPPGARISGLGSLNSLNHKQRPGRLETIGSYLGLGKLLFELCGQIAIRPCPTCRTRSPEPAPPITRRLSHTDIVKRILADFPGKLLAITACLNPAGDKGSARGPRSITPTIPDGFSYIFVNDTRQEIERAEELLASSPSQLELAIDWIEAEHRNASRLEEALGQVWKLRAYAVGVRLVDPASPDRAGSRRLYPLRNACLRCGHLSFEHKEELFDLRLAANGPGSAGLVGLSPDETEEFYETMLGPLSLGRILRESFDRLRGEFLANDGIPPELLTLSNIVEELIALGLGTVSFSHPARALSSVEIFKLMIAGIVLDAAPRETLLIDEAGQSLHKLDTGQIFQALRRHTGAGGTVIVADNSPVSSALADHCLWLDSRAKPAVEAGHHSTGNKNKSARIVRERFFLKCDASTPCKTREFNIPAGKMTCFSGPAGSGKSRVIFGTLLPLLKLALDTRHQVHQVKSGENSLEIPAELRAVESVNTRELSVGTISVPATLCGLFEPIRDIFAALNTSRMRGYTRSTFSLNPATSRKGTRGLCEYCNGTGVSPDSSSLFYTFKIPCAHCAGARFKPEVLQMKFKSLSIADLLMLSVDEASPFISNLPGCRPILESLQRFELGYLRLGAPVSELSQAEIRRIDMASAMKARQKKTVYLLEYPCAGLCDQEVSSLIATFRQVLDSGHTIVAEENHPRFAAACDLLIEMG